MKTFDFEVSFLMSCVTRGYTITAKDKDDAQRKISECIDKDGAFDFKKFEDAGGRTGSWDIENGTDHGYELTDPDSIQPVDGEDEDDDQENEDENVGC